MSSPNPIARDQFSNKLEFFLTSLSYSVGLGNVWRFPYLCYKNGGGTFFVPYFILLILLGLTLFFFESSIGQFTNLGPIQIWKISPAFKGIGYAMFMMSAYVGIYYNVIIAWSLYYVYASFTLISTTTDVPWAKCNNTWNTDRCFDADKASTLEHVNSTSPSQEYFYNQVLELSGDIQDTGHIRLHLVLCLVLAWVLVYAGLSLGTKSLGKVSYVTAIFPYVMLTALLVIGVQLEGSQAGIMHYIEPQAERLADVDVWIDAATQIFFSLSTCMGGVITLASYNPFHNNTLRDSIILVICNSLTSVYAGFTIFSVIGFIAHQTDKPIDKAVDQGVGLAFVAYPAGLARMPYAPFWSIVFFVMLLVLGFGSQMTIVETIVATIVDLWPRILQRRKPIVLGVVCAIMFLCGLPMCTGAGLYILQLIDNYAVPYSALFISLFEVIALAYAYGIDRHLDNIHKMMGYRMWPQVYWKYQFKVGVPLMIIVLIGLVLSSIKAFKYNDYEFPKYTEYVGWAITLSSVIMIPLFGLFEVFKVIIGNKTFKDIFRPDIVLENQKLLANNNNNGEIHVKPSDSSIELEAVGDSKESLNNSNEI